jgi:hypothetical protein
MNCNIQILLITWNKYRDVHFKLVVLYNICILCENVATFDTYGVFDMSTVTVWLTGLNEWMNELNEWTEWMNEWTKEWMNGQMNELNEW